MGITLELQEVFNETLFWHGGEIRTLFMICVKWSYSFWGPCICSSSTERCGSHFPFNPGSEVGNPAVPSIFSGLKR